MVDLFKRVGEELSKFFLRLEDKHLSLHHYIPAPSSLLTKEYDLLSFEGSVSANEWVVAPAKVVYLLDSKFSGSNTSSPWHAAITHEEGPVILLPNGDFKCTTDELVDYIRSIYSAEQQPAFVQNLLQSFIKDLRACGWTEPTRAAFSTKLNEATPQQV